VDALRPLYIRTPDELSEAFGHAVCAAQVQTLLPGRLLLAAQERLRLASTPAPASNVEPSVSLPKARRTLGFHVDTFHILQLSNVDTLANTFHMQFFVSLRVLDGAEDEDLCAPGEVFPMADGKPTFRPSAGWFVAKMDFNNAVTFEMMDSSIRTDGKDLIIDMRFNGTFIENMELQWYPFDEQTLNVSLALNCRSDGPMPSSFVVDDTTSKIVNADAIQRIEQEYSLEGAKTMLLVAAHTGAAGRQFPTLQASILISRRSGYVLTNVALPMAVYAFMSLSQFSVPMTDTADRLSVSITLVLVVAAYKFSISSFIPKLPYLTLLDKYVLACFLFVSASVMEASIVGFGLIRQTEMIREGFDPATGFNWRTIDEVFEYGLLVIFAVVHLIFLVHIYNPWRRKRQKRQAILDAIAVGLRQRASTFQQAYGSGIGEKTKDWVTQKLERMAHQAEESAKKVKGRKTKVTTADVETTSSKL